MAAVNYVRFIRGTPTAFKNLSKKDPDTLYFISKKEADSGVLYLGDKIISGMEKDELNLTFKDLKDVLINNHVDPDSILIYDEQSGQWVNKPFSEVFNERIKLMTGATATTDGSAGYVPRPVKGDYNKFLRGDGTWVDVSEAVGEDYSQLKQTVSTLVGADEQQSIRQIAVQVLKEQLIPSEATLDSLEKISAWIQSHASDNSINTLNQKVKNLEMNVYGEYDKKGNIIFKGLNTRVGDLNRSVEELDKKVNLMQSNVTYHTTQITDLYDRLKWQDIDLSTF